MNRKTFMANTIIFIISAIAIFISVNYLGSDNLMVGITGLFLLIAIVNKDFSRTPLRSIFKISFLTAFIAFAPYIVNLNIYTGLILNFLVVFIMIYLVVYTLNKTIYFPFIFGYTLLLTTNVSGHSLYLRTVGLVIIGVIAVLFQIIFTKLIKKDDNKFLINIIDELVNKVSSLSKNDFTYEDKIKELSTYWSRDILEKRNNSFYLKKQENIEINLIAAIEKLDRIAEHMSCSKNKKEAYDEFLLDLEKGLKDLSLFLKKDIHIEELNKTIKEINNKYNQLILKDLKLYEALEELNIIDKLTDELVKVESKDYMDFKFGKKEILEIKNLLLEDFNKDSVRFIFAFRTALLVAVAYFVCQYFHLELGKWMIFTITSVSQPYNDTVRGRAKGRFYGTLVGVIIYLPLSYIFQSVEWRIVIIAIAVYFMISFKKYAYSISMLTILFLGVVTIDIPNILLFAWDRVFFVAIGIIMVLLGNKFIFPYSIEKETKILVKKYYKCCNEILEKTFKIYKQEGIREEIRNQILIANGIENKILINNTALDSDKLREFRNDVRILLNNVNNVLNRVEYLNGELKINGYERMNNIERMKEEIENVNKSSSMREILEKYLEGIESTSEKLIYIDIYEMINSKNKCKVLMEELEVY